jgi:hypothetical protein
MVCHWIEQSLDVFYVHLLYGIAYLQDLLILFYFFLPG